MRDVPVLMLAALSSCSFLNTPRAASPNQPPCTRDIGSPIADVALGVSAALITGVALQKNFASPCDVEGAPSCGGLFARQHPLFTVGAVASVTVSPFAVSSYVGFRRAARCATFTEHVRRDQDEAESLRVVAVAAALEGDCMRVDEIERRVSELDASYARRLRADLAIGQCSVRDRADAVARAMRKAAADGDCARVDDLAVRLDQLERGSDTSTTTCKAEDRVRGLVARAQTAASSGNCDRAIQAATRVRALDRTSYATLRADPAMAACRGLPE